MMDIIDALTLAFNDGYRTATSFDPRAEIPMLGDYDGTERELSVQSIFSCVAAEDAPNVAALQRLVGIMRDHAKRSGSVEYSDCTAYWLHQLEVALAETDAWQPIETAPKDETTVWLREANSTEPALGRFSETHDLWLDMNDYAVHPSHWLPLHVPTCPQ